MKINDQIDFLRKKSYVFQGEIGQGGTGRTILIKDDVIDEVFVCKKYSPYYSEDKDLYFKYFIDEIKLLHKIYHKNIVRVFNYYLFPEKMTGYILMEFIKGQNIDDYLSENPDRINDIFVQTINGFTYLEENKILHRDIRPDNILITEEGTAKIIDFGFGKSIEFDDSDKSISLNWRYPKPDEFSQDIYDTKTEIYFIGKLFEEILTNLATVDFKYYGLISRMIANYSKRISTFFDIYREVVSQTKSEINFSNSDKNIYREFADGLVGLIAKMPYNTKYERDINKIIRSLEEIHKNSLLEEFIQNNNKLAAVFLDGQYRYFPKKLFKVESLNSMIKLLKSSSDNRRKIILNNLWERFDKIEKYHEQNDDDLPF